MVTISSPANSRALRPMTSKDGRLPLEAEPVVFDNNTSLTFKPGQQTFVAPYSTNHRSKLCSELPFRGPACLLYSINQLIRRSVGQLSSYRTTVCPSVSHSNRQTVSQTFRRTGRQSVNQSVSQSASQPVSQSVSQPASQLISQSVSQPASQLVSGQLSNQPASQSVSKPLAPSFSHSGKQSLYHIYEGFSIQKHLNKIKNKTS